MLFDLEDYLMFFVALAPIIFLVVWLLNPKSKIRIGLLISSLVLFVVFLPLTTLYLGAPLAQNFPSLANSPEVGEVAHIILPIAFFFCLLLTGLLLYRSFKKKS